MPSNTQKEMVAEQFSHHFLTTFTFEKRRDGVEIRVVGCMGLVPVFNIKPIRGVIYLRQKAIPIVDLEMIYDSGYTKMDGSACIVLVNYKRKRKKHKIGIVVSDISDVFAMASENVEHLEIKKMGASQQPDGEVSTYKKLLNVLTGIDQILENESIDFNCLEKYA